MRLATYNLWNDERGGEARRQQIVEEIMAAGADVIGLQEVTPKLFQDRLAELYPHAVFRAYDGEDEGLAVLSRYPVLETAWLYERAEDDHSAGLHVVLEAADKRISVMNVHLPWDSALRKERQIVAIDRYLHERKADACVLMGDFNGGLNSSVHRYLTGEQSLLDHEANPCWFELSSAYAALHDELPRPTLDFVRNPRWGGGNTLEIPVPADRIYLMNGFGEASLRQVSLFGTAVSPKSGYAASDHYGVWADIALA